MDEECEGKERAHSRIREASRSRSKGYKREMSREEVHGLKVRDKLTQKWRLKDKRGESDNTIPTKMPKHLFTGKMSNGKRDRR